MTAKHLYESIGQNLPNVELSQLFGKPCFKINKKAFVAFFEDEMVFKLNGEMHAEALSLDGSHLFDPSGRGRAMKEWVQVPFEYSKDWKKFAEAALEYVK